MRAAAEPDVLDRHRVSHRHYPRTRRNVVAPDPVGPRLRAGERQPLRDCRRRHMSSAPSATYPRPKAHASGLWIENTARSTTTMVKPTTAHITSSMARGLRLAP